MPLAAQISNGSIVGTITDSTGASVPAASVTLTNLATSDRRTAQTNTDGQFGFVNLLPGQYRVDVEKSGFKRLTQDNIGLTVQATVRLDGVLQVGELGADGRSQRVCTAFTNRHLVSGYCRRFSQGPRDAAQWPERSKPCHASAGRRGSRPVHAEPQRPEYLFLWKLPNRGAALQGRTRLSLTVQP